MAYAVGHISGGHFNPAVTIGLWLGGRFPAGKIVVYVVAQVAGAIAASAVLYVIASGKAASPSRTASPPTATATTRRPATACWRPSSIELVLTFFFLLVIHGVTDRRAPAGLAPLAIGLALTLIHLVSIPVTNTSVNPARSLAPALFVGGWALSQLWVFIVFPIVGGAIAGLVYRSVLESPVAGRDTVSGTWRSDGVRRLAG